MNVDSSTKIPIWIIIYTVVQILSSFVGIYGGYIDPSIFYSGFEGVDWTLAHIRHLAGMWASKNVGIVAVMLWGLIGRHPRILAAIFAFKFISDTIDILAINTRYMPETTLIQTLVSYVILGAPQAVAAYLLFTRTREEAV